MVSQLGNEPRDTKHYWGVYEDNSIVNSVRVDEWTAEWVTIASNVNSVCVDDWTDELTIIASNSNSVHVDEWTDELTIIASNSNSVHVDEWTADKYAIWGGNLHHLCSFLCQPLKHYVLLI